jgi:hypothetical protein
MMMQQCEPAFLAAPTSDALAPAAEAAPAPWRNSKASARATHAAQVRQRSGRRRQIDPTTCERDYSASETEFMLAMQEYKRRSGRNFPTWSEVLEVLRELGYEKVGAATAG